MTNYLHDKFIKFQKLSLRNELIRGQNEQKDFSITQKKKNGCVTSGLKYTCIDASKYDLLCILCKCHSIKY